jgi:hypothetical protein
MGIKLKQYKSCADCYAYELGAYGKEGFCILGFPLEKLTTPVVRTNMQLNDELFFEHKPKHGCVQKQYPRAPKFDTLKAREIAQTLNQ